MPGQTGPAWFVLQGQHSSVWFWPGMVRFDLQCKQGIRLVALMIWLVATSKRLVANFTHGTTVSQ